jgi:hypothetical protein
MRDDPKIENFQQDGPENKRVEPVADEVVDNHGVLSR